MYRWNIFTLNILFLLVLPCSAVYSKNAPVKSPQLIELWKTDSILEVPESVLYVESDNSLLVSNISGKPKEKNGKGFISKVAMGGKVDTLKWATGLNAPKGMALSGGRLYVSDIDRLVEIRLSNGQVEAEYPAPASRFLNDVATDAEGNVYVSDSSSKNSVIYKLQGGKLEVWAKGDEISKPNGLFMDDGRLLVGNSGDGCIKSVDLNTKKIETVAQIGSGIDGLKPAGEGDFIVSDWKGKTSIYTADAVKVMLDTTSSKINSADVEYIQKEKILLIPTFFDNRVVAYRVEL